MATERKRPGNTPVEQQERSAADVDATRPLRRAITGPGAADFLTASGGLDTPKSGGKGMAQTRDGGILEQERDRLVPRLGPDTEAFPGERGAEDAMTGSATGTVGGGGLDAHNDSAVRATGQDDPTVSSSKPDK